MKAWKMGRRWMTGNQGNDANGQEEVPLGDVETSVPPHPKDATDKTQKPMSGVMEALFFGSGGEFASVDDSWDPLAEDQDEEENVPVGDSLTKKEENEEGEGENSRMGQRSDQPPVEADQPAKAPFDMEKFYADIRVIENIISELRSKQSTLEYQIRTASQEGNTNPEEALSKKSELEEQLKQVNEQILTEATRLDDLMVNARKEIKAQAEAEKKKSQSMPKPKPAKDAGPEDLRTCRRGYIPRPEPVDRGQAKPDPAPKMVQVTADLVGQFGANKRELPQKKDNLRAKERELQDLTDTINEYDRTSNTTNTQSPDTVDPTQNLHSAAPTTANGNPIPKATPGNINGLKKFQLKLRQKCEKLTIEIAAMEKDLPKLKQIIENHAKVKRARKNYSKDKDNFTNSMFQSVRYGRLDDLAVMTAALDMEGVKITNLVDDRSKYSLIHMALVRDQQNIVEFLLKHSGKDMAMNTVETEECDKLTPFYIAVQHGKAKNVQLLLDVLTPEERRVYVNTKVNNKAYERTYYNELPLAAGLWSAAGSSDLTEISAMLDCLVQNGAQLDMKTDDGGNTLLHLLVAQSCESVEHMEYFRIFLKQPFTRAAGIWYNEFQSEKKKLPVKVSEIRGMKMLFSIKNKDELTPLTLAAKLESPLYVDLIDWKDVMRFPDPKLGQQLSNMDVYDVTNVTSLQRLTGKDLVYNRTSVMHVLAHNDVDITVWEEDISTIEPLKSIISQKWHIYQYIFYFWGFIHLLYMSIFTAVVFGYDGPQNIPPVQTDVDKMPTINSSNATSVKSGTLDSGYYGSVQERNPWFVLFASLPIACIIFEIIDQCSRGIGKVTYTYSLTGNAVYRVISMMFSLFTLIWIILHLIENVNQDILLSLSLLFGWIFGILFTRTINFPDRSSQIGAFSIMVQRMLFHDLFPFVIVSFFIVIAFSTAIHATLLHSEETKTEEVKFKFTLFNMLKYYLALDNGQDYESSREKEFAKAVLSVYGIISVVLLINMLIAAMNKTYEMVRSTHTDLVVRQRLAILLMLERRLPFQWLRERSEVKFENQNDERYLQITSIKKLAPLTSKGSWNWFGNKK